MMGLDTLETCTSTTDSNLKRIVSANFCMHTVVPPDDGPRYARNMYQYNRQSSKKNNNYQFFCIHTVVPPDDGPRYARNM